MFSLHFFIQISVHGWSGMWWFKCIRTFIYFYQIWSMPTHGEVWNIPQRGHGCWKCLHNSEPCKHVSPLWSYEKSTFIYRMFCKRCVWKFRLSQPDKRLPFETLISRSDSGYGMWYYKIRHKVGRRTMLRSRVRKKWSSYSDNTRRDSIQTKDPNPDQGRIFWNRR